MSCGDNLGGYRKRAVQKESCPLGKGRTVVDFDFFNQSGEVLLPISGFDSGTPQANVMNEQVIGSIEFDNLCSGDLVKIDGSGEANFPASFETGNTTIVIKIRRVDRSQTNPLLGAAVFSRAFNLDTSILGSDLLGNVLFPIDFTDYINRNNESVSYVITGAAIQPFSGEGVVAVSNTNITGTVFRSN
ncbi:hypothetical protein DH09_20215 [Bacillaceae bacterium JMAK1]|nr:hypothetical protein DH09_20215 [Bacillaceae bacterium JMAK1]